MPNEIKVEQGSVDLDKSFHQCFDSVAKERVHLGSVEAPPLEAIREFTEKASEGRDAQMFAVDRRQVVGWCDIFTTELPGFEHTGSLGMGVLQAYRRQGLGNRLARATIDIAWNEGLTRIELEVFASNSAAIALYMELSFLREGLKRMARYIDGKYDDLLLMSLLREPPPNDEST